MSFTAQVKDELSRVEASSGKVELAELSPPPSESAARCRSTGPGATPFACPPRRAPSLVRSSSRRTSSSASRPRSQVRRSVLHKTRNYLIEMPEQDGLAEDLIALGILVPGRGLAMGVPTALLGSDEAVAAFVRGAFMAGGFVANPYVTSTSRSP